MLRLNQYIFPTQCVFFWNRSVLVRIKIMLDCMCLINFSINDICVKPHEFSSLIALFHLIFSHDITKETKYALTI